MGKKKVIEQSEKETLESKKETAPTVHLGGTKKLKRIDHGRVYIKASYNNTLVSVTDQAGNLIAWVSAGSLGFGGPKKATPFAASKIIAALAEELKNSGPTNVEVIVRGIGGGRDSTLRSLVNYGFNITSVRDVTPIPHNGPRPPKPRRV